MRVERFQFSNRMLENVKAADRTRACRMCDFFCIRAMRVRVCITTYQQQHSTLCAMRAHERLTSIKVNGLKNNPLYMLASIDRCAQSAYVCVHASLSHGSQCVCARSHESTTAPRESTADMLRLTMKALHDATLRSRG